MGVHRLGRGCQGSVPNIQYSIITIGTNSPVDDDVDYEIIIKFFVYLHTDLQT
jgi:hypothetical protein